MIPSLSPIINLAAAPPICPDCGEETKVETNRHLKNRIRSFQVTCKTCRYTSEVPVQYLNVNNTRALPEEKPETEVKS